MISYPLTLPTSVAPRDQTMEQVNQIAESVSPFTGTSQIQEWSAEYWKLQRNYPPMDVATAADWTSTLAALRGKAGVFYAGTGVGTTALGSASLIGANLARWTEDFSNAVWI